MPQMTFKNPKVHAMAKALSILTGESMTQALLISLTERLERVRQEKTKVKKAKQTLKSGVLGYDAKLPPSRV